MPKIVKNRIGEIAYNSYGNKMVLVEYNSAIDIIVQFENGYKSKSRYDHFIKGSIKSPYDKSVFGVGYLGEGKYSNLNSNQHNIWQSMLNRCYYPNALKRNPTYIGCTVADEWHNYQNFAKWYDENYYEIEDQQTQLDKDILYKGNKLYSPETCIFVPEKINTIFTKSNAKRGAYPIGVSAHKDNYQSRCKDNNDKSIYLGLYNTPEEAFSEYKKYKEQLIKKLANDYKTVIPVKLYNALYNYKVEITD